ncbi:MAG: lytic transglycosylase domain-containing protein [Granulosicoccus sp.]|nr:lytic transglycosylase domain-containing protein [Granulosicoccus sp.]
MSDIRQRPRACRPRALVRVLFNITSLAILISGVSFLSASASNVIVDAQQVYLEERQLFKEAREQIKAGNDAAYQRVLLKLGDYPLQSFLQYEKLRKLWGSRKPGRADVALLNQFESETGDESLTRRLTRTLQKRLADSKQWELFLGVSKSRLAAKMPCTTLRARSETGQLKGFDEQLLELWVKPQQYPALCAGVIKTVESKHTPPVAAIWEKIYQAMTANKPEQARRMLGYLASADRKRVQNWIAASTSSPMKLINSGDLDKDTLLNRRILADLLIKWSKTDTKAAVDHWLSVKNNYRFYDEIEYDTHRQLVMRAAYRRMPEAQHWLQDTVANDGDLELAEWRVRTALFTEDWPAVLKNISRLPPEEREEDHWAYWVARALEKIGEKEQALELFEELAELQSYYGFLSADRLGLEYSIYDEPIEPDPELLYSLADQPELVRAREFNFVDLQHEARREWNNWIADERTEEEIAASAVLANHWQLHDRAIFAAGQAEQKRAISLRFPVLYRSEVAKASLEHSIEPAWIFGVMRRESAYIRDIRSHAGAVGLMQLMPKTARYVAELQGQSNWRGDLTDAKTNIGFGTFYLRHVLDRFDNHQVLATASYNAGPHRVDKWLRDGEVDADIWIDTIPFTETRRYVRAVLAYAAIYEHHLNGKPQRLVNKLKPIPASPSV